MAAHYHPCSPSFLPSFVRDLRGWCFSQKMQRTMSEQIISLTISISLEVLIQVLKTSNADWLISKTRKKQTCIRSTPKKHHQKKNRKHICSLVKKQCSILKAIKWFQQGQRFGNTGGAVQPSTDGNQFEAVTSVVVWMVWHQGFVMWSNRGQQ